MPDICFHTYPPDWPWTLHSWRRYRRRRAKIGWSASLWKGLKRHGIRPRLYQAGAPLDADIHVLWGWQKPELFEPVLARGGHVMVLERGFIQPRRGWCSIAFDGLNGRGRFADAGDDGQRWTRYFGDLLMPWRADQPGHALLIGQVPGDAALRGIDMTLWAAEQTQRLRAEGHAVCYRPHPLKPTPCPTGAVLSHGSLADDLAAADRVVMFSSTTAVEAVLAGIPSVVVDEGSIAYPMAAHSVEAPLIRPERRAWCHALAWKQWLHAELASGLAWDHVRHAIGA